MNPVNVLGAHNYPSEKYEFLKPLPSKYIYLYIYIWSVSQHTTVSSVISSFTPKLAGISDNQNFNYSHFSSFRL